MKDPRKIPSGKTASRKQPLEHNPAADSQSRSKGRQPLMRYFHPAFWGLDRGK